MPPRRWKKGAPPVPDASPATAEAPGAEVVIVWYKWNDLRLADHEPLVQAERAGVAVLHLHVLEPELLVGTSRVAGIRRCSLRRALFWRSALEDLHARLQQVTVRGGGAQGLVVATSVADAHRGEYHYSSTGAIFQKLVDALARQGIRVRTVFAHASFAEEELRTEEEVRAVLAKRDVELHTSWGGLTVHHVDDVPFTVACMPIYKGEFQRSVKRCKVRPPCPAPASLAPPPSFDGYGFTLARDAAALRRLFDGMLGTFLDEAVRQLTPTTFLEPGESHGRSTFLFPPDGPAWLGGETAALRYLEHVVWGTESLAHYKGATESFNHGDENTPINAGTRLSPYLAFGNLSVRTLVAEVKRYEASGRYGQSSGRVKNSVPPTKRLLQELGFRDFLRFSALRWRADLFKVTGPFHVEGLFWRNPADPATQHLFRRWQRGETGFPFVDAGMRELALTGYISHLHRQCCAAFLVRDLQLDWRMGAEHFEACLLDHTPDANWGNWAYRILPRPCLVPGLQQDPAKDRVLTTAEVVVWPLVHDSSLEHTLAWVPELRAAKTYDAAREPWRSATDEGAKVQMYPYKDSGLWFCAANRVNWDYEYAWFWDLSDKAVVRKPRSTAAVPWGCNGESLEYPLPDVLPISLSVDQPSLVPVRHRWGQPLQGAPAPLPLCARQRVRLAVEQSLPSVPPAREKPLAREAPSADRAKTAEVRAEDRSEASARPASAGPEGQRYRR